MPDDPKEGQAQDAPKMVPEKDLMAVKSSLEKSTAELTEVRKTETDQRATIDGLNAELEVAKTSGATEEVEKIKAGILATTKDLTTKRRELDEREAAVKVTEEAAGKAKAEAEAVEVRARVAKEYGLEDTSALKDLVDPKDIEIAALKAKVVGGSGKGVPDKRTLDTPAQGAPGSGTPTKAINTIQQALAERDAAKR